MFLYQLLCALYVPANISPVRIFFDPGVAVFAKLIEGLFCRSFAWHNVVKPDLVYDFAAIETDQDLQN